MAEDRMLSDEILLGLIKKNGGSGGTTDYENLENLPEINGVELKGNKTLSDLGIASAQDVKNEFIGTLAEWNALSPAQQKACDTYQITDDYSEALMPNYSTTEQKTGQKWIDGKDIYFRAWDFGENVSVTSNDYYTGFNIDSSNMDKVLLGTIINNDGTLYVNASYDPTKVNHTLLGIKPVNNCNVRYLTLYYTKTA